MGGHERIIGVIPGEGIGPEIIDSAIRCLTVLDDRYSLGLVFRFYQGKAPALRPKRQQELNESLAQLTSFYRGIMAEGGVVLRGAVFAWLVYKLRERFNQSVKIITFEKLPEFDLLGSATRLPKKLVVIRENRMGPYHSRERVITGKAGGHKCVEVKYMENSRIIREVVEYSFGYAKRNNIRKIWFLFKEDVLMNTYDIWSSAFHAAASRHGGRIKWDSEHPDAGMAQLLMGKEYSPLIVAPDEIGDLISDAFGALYYGTRAMPASVNINPLTGFASYQTVHGAGSDIAGKGIANPVGMLAAAEMMLRLTFNRGDVGEQLKSAYLSVIKAGFRTKDMILGKQIKGIGTDLFTEYVCKRLKISQ